MLYWSLATYDLTRICLHLFHNQISIANLHYSECTELCLDQYLTFFPQKNNGIAIKMKNIQMAIFVNMGVIYPSFSIQALRNLETP
jgi:hypothetical protein